MENFRKWIKGPMGVVLIAIFAVPFVISGFYGYFASSGPETHVAEVDGTRIAKEALQNQLQRLRDNMRSENPGLDPALIDSFVNPNMTLGSMINGILLEKEALDSDVIVSPVMAAQRIRQNPNFTHNGEFSEQVYEQILRQAGINPKNFIHQMRTEMASNQLRAGFEETDFVLPEELTTRQKLEGQVREVRFARKRVAQLLPDYEPTDEQIEAYYQDNQQDFMRPAQYQVEYVLLTPDHYEDQVTVTEQDVKNEYEARLQIMKTLAENKQKRKVAHILFKTGDVRSVEEATQLANDAVAKVRAGEDFDVLAGDISEDAATKRQGGLLGTVEKGMLPESLELALFELEEGAVSGPIESDAGVHILKLLEVERESLPSFEDMKDKLAVELKAGKQEALLAEDLITLEDMAYEQPDLVVLVEELDLELEETDWFSLESLPELFLAPSVAQAIREPAFLEQKTNSRVLEPKPGSYMVMRLKDKQPPSPIALSEVEDNIRRRLAREQAEAFLDTKQTELQAQLESGNDLDALAETLNAEPSSLLLTRNQTEPSIELVHAVFQASKNNIPAKPDIIRLADGDLVVLQVMAVQDGVVQPPESREAQMARAQLAAEEGRRSLSQLLGWLKASRDVEVFESRLAEQPVEEEL